MSALYRFHSKVFTVKPLHTAHGCTYNMHVHNDTRIHGFNCFYTNSPSPPLAIFCFVLIEGMSVLRIETADQKRHFVDIGEIVNSKYISSMQLLWMLIDLISIPISYFCNSTKSYKLRQPNIHGRCMGSFIQ